MNRSSFMERVFWKSIRKGELIVGFNLPFDLSRLATQWGEGNKGDWSLASHRTLGKTLKQDESHQIRYRPRIIVDAQNSKMAFIKLGSLLLPEEWPTGRFLDLRTLGWALRNKSFNLKRACKAFRVKGKVDHKPTGQINPEEIEYCRGDVAATHRLLNAMMHEFNPNPIDLRPDKAYSPASIAKGYLDAMQIKEPSLNNSRI